MLFKEALRPDGSVLAQALSWNATRAFADSTIGVHSMHVSTPGGFRLSYSGQLLNGMSTLIACCENSVDMRTSVDRKS
jgi:hypothetical protein